MPKYDIQTIFWQWIKIGECKTNRRNWRLNSDGNEAKIGAKGKMADATWNLNQQK